MTNNTAWNNSYVADDSGGYQFLNTFAKQNPSNKWDLEVFLDLPESCHTYVDFGIFSYPHCMKRGGKLLQFFIPLVSSNSQAPCSVSGMIFLTLAESLFCSFFFCFFFFSPFSFKMLSACRLCMQFLLMNCLLLKTSLELESAKWSLLGDSEKRVAEKQLLNLSLSS